jgi:hypothetical protein
MCRGKEKVSSQSKRSPRAGEFFPKSPSLQYLVMNRTVNGYGHPSASKSMPSANTSGEPSSPCTTSNAYGNAAEQYLGIIRTNALPIEADGSEGGIFLEVCRINHACDNNAQKNWNENIKRHTVS